MLDRFTGITFPFARNDVVTEGFDFRQHRVNFWHDVFTVNHHWAVRTVTQGGVQYGTAFSMINLLTIEHGINSRTQIHFVSQIDQQIQSFISDQIFGVIHQDIVFVGGGELVKTSRVCSKQFTQLTIFIRRKMSFQRFPRLGLGRIDVFHRVTIPESRLINFYCLRTRLIEPPLTYAQCR